MRTPKPTEEEESGSSLGILDTVSGSGNGTDLPRSGLALNLRCHASKAPASTALIEPLGGPTRTAAMLLAALSSLSATRKSTPEKACSAKVALYGIAAPVNPTTALARPTRVAVSNVSFGSTSICPSVGVLLTVRRYVAWVVSRGGLGCSVK